MAETLISPGVLARENDQSFIQRQPEAFGAALIGPSQLGPVGIPTKVTSFSQWQNIFGSGLAVSGAQEVEYISATSIRNYFSQGGESLLFTRVVSGSFGSAFTTPTSASNCLIAQSGNLALESFRLKTISEGDILNNFQAADSADGTLTNGTANNVRWEVTTVDYETGKFSLLIRRGNDSTNNKVILETWSDLSLDVTSPRYIAKVIGDSFNSIVTDSSTGETYVKSNGNYKNNSNYVYVSLVPGAINGYFDNAGAVKSSLTSSMPIPSSGSFVGGSGGLGLSTAHFGNLISQDNVNGLRAVDFTSSISLLNNKEYTFNVITAPGLNYQNDTTEVASLVTLAENKQDCIAIIDLVAYNAQLGTVTTQAGSINSSYAATYWPWLQVIDGSGNPTWTPPSALIPGVYAFTDKSSEPWFAPAGMIRGALGNVIRAERRLTTGNRDTLYTANVNPIATFPGNDVVVFGQKTLQKQASALDRVNVRRLLISLKSFISQIADNLVFEQNTAATRNNFLTQVNPYLETVQQRQGLYAFKVVMDETNNGPDVVDRNELVGAIYLQPTKTAEFIMLDFNILPTGATFPS
jgi:hypothetical protein